MCIERLADMGSRQDSGPGSEKVGRETSGGTLVIAMDGPKSQGNEDG